MYGFKRCTQVPSFQGVACCALVLDQPSQPKMYFPESLYDFELELMRGKCVSDLKYKRKATAIVLWRSFWLEVIRVSAEVLVASNLLFLPNSMSSFASCLPALWPQALNQMLGCKLTEGQLCWGQILPYTSVGAPFAAPPQQRQGSWGHVFFIFMAKS